MRLRAVLAVCVTTSVASANPRPLPFTISTDAPFEHELQMTQVADLVPLPQRSGTADERTELAMAFATELEYGMLDRLELVFGVVLAAVHAVEDAPTALRQRAKFLVLQPGDYAVDVAVIGEVTEHATAIDFEARLAARLVIDRVKLYANAGSELEHAFERALRDHALVPIGSFGATVEILPALAVGVEAWGRYEADELFAYGGPVVGLVQDKVWLTVGAYTRVNDRELRLGDTYGRYWFRALVGFDL